MGLRFYELLAGYRSPSLKSICTWAAILTIVGSAVAFYWSGTASQSSRIAVFAPTNRDFGSLFGRGQTSKKRFTRLVPSELSDTDDNSIRGLDKLLLTGGFTFDPVDMDVSGQGIALSVFPEYGRVFESIDDVSPSAIYQFLEDSQPIWSTHDDVHIGGWYNRRSAVTPEGDNRVYLDLIVVVDSVERAIELGKQHGQLAAYNLQTCQLIPIMTVDEQAQWKQKHHVQSTKTGNRENRQVP